MIINLRRLAPAVLGIAVLILSQGCAATFGRKVTRIETETSGVRLEMDGSSVTGPRVRVGQVPRVIMAFKDGYRPMSIAIAPDQFNVAYLGNLIPVVIGAAVDEGPEKDEFGNTVDGSFTDRPIFLGIAASATLMLYDIGYVKAYSASYTIPALEPLPTKEEGDKYFIVDKAEVDLDAGDIRVEAFASSKRKNRGQSFDSSISEEEIKNVNYELSYRLNSQLVEMGFADTSKTFFPKPENTVKIDCVLDGISAVVVAWHYFQADMDLVFVLKDYFGTELYRKTLVGKSIPYPTNVDFDLALDNALEDGFISFLKDPEVKQAMESALQANKESFESMGPLEITKPKKTLTKISDIISASVTVITEDGHGSGAIISPEGYIVTNYHVVGGAKTVTIKLQDEKEYEAAVLRKDLENDLALVKIDGVSDLPAIMPVSELTVPIGDEVYAIGTPNDVSLGQTLSKGIVSAKRKQEDRTYIQTDVKISPGNSGGPLVTPDGQYLGVINSKVVGLGVEGIGFAIPGNLIYSRLKISYK